MNILSSKNRGNFLAFPGFPEVLPGGLSRRDWEVPNRGTDGVWSMWEMEYVGWGIILCMGYVCSLWVQLSAFSRKFTQCRSVSLNSVLSILTCDEPHWLFACCHIQCGLKVETQPNQLQYWRFALISFLLVGRVCRVYLQPRHAPLARVNSPPEEVSLVMPHLPANSKQTVRSPICPEHIRLPQE